MKYPILCKAIEYIVDKYKSIDHKTLVNLLYLTDKYSEAVYYRWNGGAYSKEIITSLEWMDGIEIVKNRLVYTPGLSSRLKNIELDLEFKANLDIVRDNIIEESYKQLEPYNFGDKV